MDETILYPSPNWFQSSGLVVTKDGWLIYGGPSKSLCVLESLAPNGVIEAPLSHRAHVHSWAHPEKITSVALCPNWPEKREIITGSADGLVKQWSLDKIKTYLKYTALLSHEVHSKDKEEVVGVDYCNSTCAITASVSGCLVKWELNSNVVKTFLLLKGFRPTSISCSQHVPLTVAVGTKQGVILVVDLNGVGKTLYKVRAQDDEIMGVSWCPQFNVEVKKSVTNPVKVSKVSARLQQIKHEGAVQEAAEQIGLNTDLPDDSFNDTTIVEEDDMFDIYKDHEEDEFGHKKYQPEDIVIKIKEEKIVAGDYLEECLKLKDKILNHKNKPDETIESMVKALDEINLDNERKTNGSASKSSSELQCEDSIDTNDKENSPEIDSSIHVHKHLLATVGKNSGVKIWSKTGKLVGSCFIVGGGKNNHKHKAPSCAAILWCRPDQLFIADGKSQLLQCNPLNIDSKNKLQWSLVHTLHKRSLYSIASNAPRVQPTDFEGGVIWTSSQDRNLVAYSIDKKEVVAEYHTCGGFIYSVQSCPYDASRLAIAVGDGAVRVWETDTLANNEAKLARGKVYSYWQNVGGKVLNVAWHPTKENLLAFSTAESRVGLIDTGNKCEKPARVLLPSLCSGVYSLCWGKDNLLYACGGGEVVIYDTEKPDEAPTPLEVTLEGTKWNLDSICYREDCILVGCDAGGVAALEAEPSHSLLAAAFFFSKMIQMIEWHPVQTSNSSEAVSPYKDMFAVCSQDKQNMLVIAQYVDTEDGGKKLQLWKTLSGHTDSLLQLNWNPHRDMQLLTTSRDNTVRVWDGVQGCCVSVFPGHLQSTLSGTWMLFPSLETHVLSGGSDCTLRLWDTTKHSIDSELVTQYQELNSAKKDKKKKKKEKLDKANEATVEKEIQSASAACHETKVKTSKKFLLPVTYKQIILRKINGAKKMFQKYLEKNKKEILENGIEKNGDMDEGEQNGVEKKDGDDSQTKGEAHQGTNTNGADLDDEDDYDLDYLKIFGSINEFNELIEMELNRHKVNKNWESWFILMIFRGHFDALMQFACQKDLIDPFLLSVATCVSVKFWRENTRLYVNQMDRLVAKDEEEKLYANHQYGGAVYRKAVMLLCINDVKGAVETLVEAKLFKEAYVLCRARYVDSIAEETLQQWGRHCEYAGDFTMAAVCYFALENLPQAAVMLGRSGNEESLSLSAAVAKVSGQMTFAGHIEKKKELIKNNGENGDKSNHTSMLQELPSRVELMMKNNVETEDGSDGLDVKQ